MIEILKYNNIISQYDNPNILLCDENKIPQNYFNHTIIINEYGYKFNNTIYKKFKNVYKLIKSQNNFIIFIIKIEKDNINLNAQKNIITNIIKAYNFLQKNKISLGKNINNKIISSIIINNNNASYKDIICCIKALSLSDMNTRYSYIYDVVTEEIDNDFSRNNYCDFKCDKCIASRNNQTVHEKMGCCYSFESNFGIAAKNVKLCEYLDKDNKCSINCIACKLFTCKFLRQQGIHFNPKSIPLLACFFNKKQLEILTSNFFVPKDKIIKKLLENNNMPYFLYYIFEKYRIKK